MIRPPLLAVLGAAALTSTSCAAVSNPCAECCQQAQLYLDRCGYSWESVYEGEFDDIDGCYDAWWSADEDRTAWCSAEAAAWPERACTGAW